MDMYERLLLEFLWKYKYIKREEQFNLGTVKPKNYCISESDFNNLISEQDLSVISEIYNKCDNIDVSKIWWLENFLREYGKEIKFICDKIAKLENITKSERYIFENFIVLNFVENKNLESYDNFISLYTNNYLNNQIDEYNLRKIALLSYNLSREIKNEYKRTCQIEIKNNKYIDRKTQLESTVKAKNKITLNFNNLFSTNLDEEIPQKDFNMILIHMYFAILHEKEHIRQFVKMFNNEQDLEVELWKKEMIVARDEQFYYKYSINFDVEKKANNFALDNCINYYRTTMGENKKIETNFLKNLLKQIKKQTIEQNKFNRLLDENYAAIVNQNPDALLILENMLGEKTSTVKR
jgi:hypothetical protein